MEGYNLSGTLTLNYFPTNNPNISAEVKVRLSGNFLSVNSPIAETVQVYSINGMLLRHFQKPAGQATFSVNQEQNSVLIITGSSGWVRKVKN
jgi:hypothetical protein